MSVDNRRRFGFSGISSKMTPRYVKALTLGIEFFQYGKRERPEIGDWLGDLKGMYIRCYKRDQPDWHAVWTILGEPNDADCRRISGWLGGLRRSLNHDDPAEYSRCFRSIPQECLQDCNRALDLLADDNAPVHSHIVQNPNFCDSSPELKLGEQRLLWSSTIVVDSVER